MSRLDSVGEDTGDARGDEQAYMRCPRCRRGYEMGKARCPVDNTVLVEALGRNLLGRVIANRYRIEQLLGSGGMGEVYRAWHLLLEKPLAIKVVLPLVADRTTAVALLHREARNASRVDHPNVVRVHDLEFDEGMLFLTMDYVPGPTLAEVIQHTGALAPALVSEIVTDVAAGLDAIHRAAIVHRDLKPNNVVLTYSRTGRPIAKLLDFGISRVFDDPNQSITESGQVIGTPVFMSPEQRAGLALDKRADVFALGVMATYLLAGRLPRIEPSTCLRLTDVTAASSWPEEIRHVLMRAMVWERTQRTTSARHFAVQLKGAVDRMPPTQGPQTLADLFSAAPWTADREGRKPKATLPPFPVPAALLNRTTELARETPKEHRGPQAVALDDRKVGPKIVAIKGPLAGSEFLIGTEPVCIGRDPGECPILFPESAAQVSRIHASILWNPVARTFLLRDEGSKNCTFINGGQPIEPDVLTEIPDGSTFSLGHPDNLFRVIAE